MPSTGRSAAHPARRRAHGRADAAQLPHPATGPGLPYTRSARPRALKAIGGTIAVFGGSRYAYLYGKKVRLDDTNMLHAEAVFHDNKLFVPQAFASALDLKTFTPWPGLPYLADKWVYSFPRAASSLPASIPTLEHRRRKLRLPQRSR